MFSKTRAMNRADTIVAVPDQPQGFLRSQDIPHNRDKKAIEEREPMELLACNIPIPSSRKKSAKARQKLPVPQAVLPGNPSRP
jgi:hypothetical protein